MNTKVIDDTGWVNGRQSNEHRALIKIGCLLFQIEVKVDSHDFQSWAAIRVLSEGREWTTLASRQPQRDYRCEHESKYTKVGGQRREAMLCDLEEIAFKIAAEIDA